MSPTFRPLIAWRNAVFALFFISGLSLASWVSRIPAVRDTLQLSLDQVGLVIFGLSAGSVLGLIASAGMLARFGARTGMVTAIVVSSVGMAAVGSGAVLFASAVVVFIGLALLGFGMGSLDVMMNVEGAAAEREIGKTLMPLMHACFSLGTVAGALLGAGASAVHLSVLWHLVAVAAVVLATTIVAVRSIPHRPDLGDEVTGAPKPSLGERLRENLSVWRDPRLLLIGVIVLGFTFAEGSANDWITLAAVDGHGASNTDGAIVFGIFVTAMTIGRIAGGPVIDRVGRVPALRVCAGLAIAGLLLFILAPGPWAVITGTVLWGLGASLGFPVGMSAAADDPRHAAARVSAIAIMGYFAFLVGPPLLGLLGQDFGILTALYVVLVLMVLAGLATPAARERDRRTLPVTTSAERG